MAMDNKMVNIALCAVVALLNGACRQFGADALDRIDDAKPYGLETALERLNERAALG